ncbi:hypothetical protein D3C84_947470 [compost metagenome]
MLQIVQLPQPIDTALGGIRLTFFDTGLVTGLVGTTLFGTEPEHILYTFTQHPFLGGMVQRQKGLVAQQQAALTVTDIHRIG